MSTPHDGTQGAAARRSPALPIGHADVTAGRVPGSAVIPADPVLDAELVDDGPGGQGEHHPPAPSWWQRSPRVPVALKSRAHAAQAARSAALVVMCSPWWLLRAAGRGAVLAARVWRRWVSVRDYRQAAEGSDKLADKYLEIRELTLFRWRITGAVAVTGTAGVAVADVFYGHLVLLTTAILGAAVLAITGRRTDGSPGRRAVLAGPRSLTWTMDPKILIDAFRDAKLIGKDETLRLVERASRVGAGLILDPYTRLYVADFKAGKDWDAAAQVAHRFLSGDEPAHVLELAAWLVELVTEVQGRYRRMRELDNQTCPESKITPAMSRDLSLNMPITGVFIDEVQVPLEERTPVQVQGKTIPAGQYIGELLTWLAKKGPAAGIVLVLATQRPDSTTIPSALRAVLGSRFALRVMDWRDSNIILGEQMNTRGWDSSRLLPSHKGVGILRPDGETTAGADVLAMMVRTDYMPNHDWATLCARGRALRAAAGTLTGHAIGAESLPALDPATVAHVIGANLAEQTPSAPELPEPLASVVAYLADLDDDGREFIPTAELVDVLDMEPTAFGRQMGELGCRPRPARITTEDGATRQVRGYVTADIRAAVAAQQGDTASESDGDSA